MKQLKSIILFISFLFISNLSTGQEYYITGDTSIYCNQVYTFTIQDIRGNPPYIIEWNVDGGTQFIVNSTPMSVDIIFPQAGLYLIRAITEDNQTVYLEVWVDCGEEYYFEGCQEFINGCLTVCEGSSTILYFEGRANISGADIVINRSGSYEITWGEAGIGEIQLITQSNEPPICVNILPEPEANFDIENYPNLDTITVCRNQTITFENLSTPGISREWSFGDGNNSTLTNPMHQYSNTGIYTVTLSENSVCDCSDQSTKVIEVLNSLAPTIDCISTICPETRQVYTAMADGCNEYVWSVSGNGDITAGGSTEDDYIEVIWHEGPEGIITLSVSDCAADYCQSVNSFRVPILSVDGPIEGDDNVCAFDLSQYTAPFFNGTEYTWSLTSSGTIMNPNNTNALTVLWDEVSVITTATIRVEYENCNLECSGSAEFEVTITPQINIRASSIVCQGQDFLVEAFAGFDGTTPAQVEWVIKDDLGNLVDNFSLSTQHTFNLNLAPGVYELSAINTLGTYCNEIITKLFEITSTPTAPLGIEGDLVICPGQNNVYTVLSSGTYSTDWVITEGSNTFNYTGESIVHNFGNVGPYSIQASHRDLSNPDCNSSPVTINVEMVQAVNLIGQGVSCFESTEIYLNSIPEAIDITWAIIPTEAGEIVSSSNSEIEVFWARSGIATIEFDACGITNRFEVEVLAQLDFSVVGDLTLCAGTTTQISVDDATLSLVWKNEIGTVVGTNPTIDLTGGHYTVEGTDQNQCTLIKNFYIEQFPIPEVHISSPNNVPYCINFGSPILLVSNTDKNQYDFNWYKDNVQVGTGPEYFATSFGNYRLEATNEYGCSKDVNLDLNSCCPVVCDTLQIGGGPGDPPVPRCIPSDVISYDVQQTSCSSHTYSITDPDYDANSARWYLRNIKKEVLGFGTGSPVTITIGAPGYYTVHVFADKNDGTCGVSTFRDSMTMLADFYGDTGCQGNQVEFNDLTTTIPNENITAWSWDFGDPSSVDNTSTLRNPNHQFNTSGTFLVTLTTTAGSGCISEVEHSIIIYPSPVLNVVHDDNICESTAAGFILPDDLIDIEWSFGDPGSANNTAFSPEVYHTFANTGLHSIQVSATNVYGCRNTNTVNVDVHENTLAGDIDVLPSNTICERDQAILIAPGSGLEYLWSTAETTEQIVVTTSADYSVTVSNLIGCKYTPDSEFIEVVEAPVVIIKGRKLSSGNRPNPWLSALELCFGEDYELRAFSNPNTSFEWGDGWITDIRSVLAQVEGTHDYRVQTTDNASSCLSEWATYQVIINPNPNAPSITQISGDGCSDVDNILTIQSPDASLDYSWSHGPETNEVTINAAGTYSVVATNSFGCTATSNEISIQSAPSTDFIPFGCIEKCKEFDLCLPSNGDITGYILYQDGIEIESGGGLPSNYLITDDGSYYFELTSTNGCTSVSEPLNIELEDAIGTITIVVYYDVDGDGVISAADTLMPGSKVILTYTADNFIRTNTTGSNGEFQFIDLESTDYEASIDPNGLALNTIILINKLQAQIINCDDDVTVELLLGPKCEDVLYGPELEFSLFVGDTLNYVDSTWWEGENHEHLFTTAEGCDSIVTIVIVWDTLEIPCDTLIFGPDVLFELTYGDTLHYIDSIWWEGENHEHYFITDDGCDSVVRVLITWEESPCDSLVYGGFFEYELTDGDTLYYVDSTWWKTGAYEHYYTTSEGCDSIEYININVIPRDTLTNRTFIPTAFSPNNDKFNDRFMIYSDLPGLELIEFQVYNRWGNRVYEERNIKVDNMQGWDGKHRNQEANQGVYIYWAKAQLEDGQTVFYKGDLTLIR